MRVYRFLDRSRSGKHYLDICVAHVGAIGIRCRLFVRQSYDYQIT